MSDGFTSMFAGDWGNEAWCSVNELWFYLAVCWLLGEQTGVV